MKPCLTCKQEKPLTSFSRNSRTKDRLSVHCRECCKELRKLPNRYWHKPKPDGLAVDMCMNFLRQPSVIL